MIYTTEELIAILDQELRANWQGQRLMVSLNQRIADPVVTKALDPLRLSKVFAYPEFRSQIHQYQRDHGVSGIIWRTVSFQGRSICYPEVYNQLIALEADKELLKQWKPKIWQFWQEATQGLSYQKVHTKGSLSSENDPQFYTFTELEALMEETEWAELDATQTALYLGLCWGKPDEYHCQWAFPHSGYYRVMAGLEKDYSVQLF